MVGEGGYGILIVDLSYKYKVKKLHIRLRWL